MSNTRGFFKSDRITFQQGSGATTQEIVIGVDPLGFSTLLFGNSQMLGGSNTINYGNAAFLFDLGLKRLAIGGLSSATTTIDISGSLNVSGNITGNGVGLVTDGNLQSTTVGLGNIYISTGGGGSGDVSLANLTSTTRGLGNIYASTVALRALSSYTANLLQNTSTWVSSVSIFTSNTATGISSLHGILSSGLSTVALFTSSTSNYSRNLLQDFSTGLSTVALFTSNSSNYFLNNAGGSGVSSLLGDVSTGLSTVALFTSNTSNYSRNLLQDFSTGLSTVALFTSNTSNYSRGFLQDYSTAVSSVALFTSNTSNYSRNLLQNTSTWVSSVALFTSNTSNSIGTSLVSTNIGLATYGYVCTTQLGFYLSTLPLTFTTSSLVVSSITFGQGDGYLIFPDLQAQSVSAPYIQASSIVTLTTSSLSILVSSVQATKFIGDGSLVTGLPAISSLSLQSTIQGLGTSGYISSQTLLSTVTGLGTASYISSAQLLSTTAGLGTANYLSSTQLTSTIQGLATTGYISSLSNVGLISSQQLQASSFTGMLADSFTLVLADL